MRINGVNYRLTKHGRKRFIKRVGYMSDADILRTVGTGKALGFIDTGYSFKFKPDWKQRQDLRLVTVYMGDAMVCLEPILDIQDRASEFTFNFSDFERRINHAE